MSPLSIQSIIHTVTIDIKLNFNGGNKQTFTTKLILLILMILQRLQLTRSNLYVSVASGSETKMISCCVSRLVSRMKV